MNYSLDIAQITQGSLWGRLITKETAGIAIVQRASNQGLIFNGHVNSSIINFTIESSNDLGLHRVQGIPMANHGRINYSIKYRLSVIRITMQIN